MDLKENIRIWIQRILMFVVTMGLGFCVYVAVRCIELRQDFKRLNIYGKDTYVVMSDGGDYDADVFTKESYDALGLESMGINYHERKTSVYGEVIKYYFVPKYEDSVFCFYYSRSGPTATYSGLWLNCDSWLKNGRKGRNANEVVTLSNHKLGEKVDVDGRNVEVVGILRDMSNVPVNQFDIFWGRVRADKHADVFFFTDSVSSYKEKQAEQGSNGEAIFDYSKIDLSDIKILESIGIVKSLASCYPMNGSVGVYILLLFPIAMGYLLYKRWVAYIDVLYDCGKCTKQKLVIMTLFCFLIGLAMCGFGFDRWMFVVTLLSHVLVWVFLLFNSEVRDEVINQI